LRNNSFYKNHSKFQIIQRFFGIADSSYLGAGTSSFVVNGQMAPTGCDGGKVIPLVAHLRRQTAQKRTWFLSCKSTQS